MDADSPSARPDTGAADAAGEPEAAGRPSQPEGESLGRQTIHAAQWQTAASATKGILQFGVSVLLARLLAPTDFGLFALALVVVGFAEMIVDLGLGPAVVQRETLTDRHIRAAYSVSTLIGVGVAALLVVSAPLAVPLLNNPVVPQLLRWQSLIFVFGGVGATSRALMQRRLDFRGLFFVDLISYLLGYALVAVTMALFGYGVWSLVVGALVQAFLHSAVALVMARHPLRPLLSRREMSDLFAFGFGVILNRLVVYASLNGDNFLVGRWLGAHFLGLYNRAFQLMMLPLGHLGNISWTILFSAYSRLRGDPERLGRAFLKGIQLTTLLAAPIMAGMVVAGPHLVVGLLGARWIEAAVPLQVLCAAGIFRAIYSSAGALTHAMGLVYSELRRQAVYAVLVVVGVLVGVRAGIAGVAVGVAAATVVMYLLMAQLSVRATGCGWAPFFGAQLPGLFLAAVVSAAGLAVRLMLERQGAPSGAILAAVVVACAVALLAGVYLLPRRVRPVELFQTLDQVVGRLPPALRLPMQRAMRLHPGRVSG